MLSVKFNQKNNIIIDKDHGCRIEELNIGGSYLMFPWVNRIVKNPYAEITQNQFNDGKGYPLHGLYANTKSEIKLPTIHGFEEIFTIGQNWFQIQLNVQESNQDPNPYCFGYHPYFQLSKPLNQLKITTNLNKMLALEEDLLMRWPKELKEWSGKLDGNEKYDTLFQGSVTYEGQKLGNFVQLDDGVNKLRIESNLEYWQIYTPPDGFRIAIEPMSFHGNLYEICQISPEVREKLPKSGNIRVSIS